MNKSMSSLADFLAKTSAQPGAAQAYQEAVADCGSNTTVLSTKSNRSSRSSKTSLPFGLEDWTKCLGHSLRSGTMQNGIVYPLQPLALLTAGTASGSWPTPRATDYKNGRGKTGNRSVQNAYKAGWTLSEKVLMWPTPRATDGSKGTRTTEGALKEFQRGKNLDLGTMVKLWPTPTASMGGSNIYAPATTERGHGVNLTGAVGGTLNPTWVEWLMGFPAEWTACAHLETRLSRKSQK